MTMTFPKVVLGISGLIFLLLGVANLLDPAGSMKLIGVNVPAGRGTVEARGIYGGLQLGLGLFMLVATARERWLRPGLSAQIFCFGGLAAGRVLGMLLIRDFGGPAMVKVVIEVTATLIGLIAFRHAKQVVLRNRYQFPPG